MRPSAVCVYRSSETAIASRDWRGESGTWVRRERNINNARECIYILLAVHSLHSHAYINSLHDVYV